MKVSISISISTELAGQVTSYGIKNNMSRSQAFEHLLECGLELRTIRELETPDPTETEISEVTPAELES